jgi:hypothetical protein
MAESPAHAVPRLSRIVLGVTGGIAAYKSAELVRLLVKDGVTVDVVLTDAGARFVTATTFQALSGRPVASSLWQSGAGNAMGHVGLDQQPHELGGLVGGDATGDAEHDAAQAGVRFGDGVGHEDERA